MDPVNPKTGMSLAASKQFVRNHFEEFVGTRGEEPVKKSASRFPAERISQLEAI